MTKYFFPQLQIVEANNSNDFWFFFLFFSLCSQVARLGGKSGGLITHSPFRGTCADVLIRAPCACISSFGISDSSSSIMTEVFFRQTLLKITYTIMWINGRGLWHCHSHWQIYDFTNHIIIWSVIHYVFFQVDEKMLLHLPKIYTKATLILRDLPKKNVWASSTRERV